METIFVESDRVEAKSMDKKLRFLKWCGIALLCIAVLRIIMKQNSEQISSGWWIDWLLFLSFGIYCVYKLNSKGIKQKLGQFIFWNSKGIEYRVKGLKDAIYIDYSSIIGLEIQLDLINIKLNGGETISIDISDFQGYEERTRIKENFEKIKNGV